MKLSDMTGKDEKEHNRVSNSLFSKGWTQGGGFGQVGVDAV